jgi:lysyl-tRNA synthetase class 2
VYFARLETGDSGAEPDECRGIGFCASVGRRRRGSGIRRFLVGDTAGPSRAQAIQADRARIREFIQSPLSDGDTLDPFSAREDKEYVFAPDRGAALAYRSLFGVALGTGDPIGAKDQFLGCLRRFVAHSDERGLRPVIMLVREDRLALYEHLGFRTLYLGDEAVLDVAGFTLDSPRMRNVRQAVKRSANFGVTTEVVREADIPPSLVASLREITVRARRGKREEGFSAALEEPFTVPQPTCLVALCRDRTGALIGFQRYSPCCGETKLSVDAMRRVPSAPNGITERMIFEVLQWAGHNGVVELSLNFVAFRRLLQGLDVAAGNAVAARVIRRLNPAGAPNLFAFTNKFRPRWVPRYLAYRSLTDIPRFAVATLSAEGRLPPWVVRLGVHREP